MHTSLIGIVQWAKFSIYTVHDHKRALLTVAYMLSTYP